MFHLLAALHDALEDGDAVELQERDEDMILMTPAPKKIWTLRDVQEAAAKRRQVNWAEEMRRFLNPPVTVTIVDETEIDESVDS